MEAWRSLGSGGHPDESHHVSGKAVDIGPAAAYGWMLAHSTQFGLCQVFANEKWHYELTADAEGNVHRCVPTRQASRTRFYVGSPAALAS